MAVQAEVRRYLAALGSRAQMRRSAQFSGAELISVADGLDLNVPDMYALIDELNEAGGGSCRPAWAQACAEKANCVWRRRTPQEGWQHVRAERAQPQHLTFSSAPACQVSGGASALSHDLSCQVVTLAKLQVSGSCVQSIFRSRRSRRLASCCSIW